MSTSAPVTPERIMQFAWGYIPTFVLETAIHHRVFDVLDGGPKTLKETAEATGAWTASDHEHAGGHELSCEDRWALCVDAGE